MPSVIFLQFNWSYKLTQTSDQIWETFMSKFDFLFVDMIRSALNCTSILLYSVTSWKCEIRIQMFMYFRTFLSIRWSGLFRCLLQQWNGMADFGGLCFSRSSLSVPRPLPSTNTSTKPIHFTLWRDDQSHHWMQSPHGYPVPDVLRYCRLSCSGTRRNHRIHIKCVPPTWIQNYYFRKHALLTLQWILRVMGIGWTTK